MASPHLSSEDTETVEDAEKESGLPQAVAPKSRDFRRRVKNSVSSATVGTIARERARDEARCKYAPTNTCASRKVT